MNLFVADPDWGGWIVAYFFLGGIAAGAYLLACLVEWFGTDDDARVARVAHTFAFPLIVLCAGFLIVDLDRPDRFWHMVLKSEVVKQAAADGFPFTAAGWGSADRFVMLKPWSPMSLGSHALGLFGVCSAMSFFVSVRPHWRIVRWVSRPWVQHAVRAVGAVTALYVASYTGSLLSATNQPVWSDTVWLSALFLASSVSTGLAAILLVARRWSVGTPAARAKVESADRWAIGLEAALLGIFMVALGPILDAVLLTGSGILLVFGTAVFGLVLPLALHHRSAVAAAVCVLVGGLCLRVGVVTVNAELLARGGTVATSPEAVRQVGQPGADVGNRGREIVPGTKLPEGP